VTEPGYCDADGVRNRNLQRLHLGESAGNGTTRSVGDFAFERANESHRFVTCARIPAACANGAISSQARIVSRSTRPGCVGKTVSGSGHHTNLGAPGCQRPVEAFSIQHQTDVLNIAATFQSGEHCLRVRHLRNAFRIDETRDFHAVAPASTNLAINCNLVAVGNTSGSLCKPSRGPTSTISMDGMGSRQKISIAVRTSL